MRLIMNRVTASVALLTLVAVGSTVAAGAGLDLKASEIRGNETQKDVNVLQNRYFLKAWRPELGIMGGSFLNEAYTDTTAVGGRVSLFPSEWFGIEAQYLKTTVKDSADKKALNGMKYYKTKDDANANPPIQTGVYPEFNPIRKVMDFNMLLTPFYGKLNLLDMLIVYTDIYLSLGGSRLDTEQGQKSALLWGIGERFYLAKYFSVRADFRVRTFKEQRAGQETTRNAMSVDLGAGVFVW